MEKNELQGLKVFVVEDVDLIAQLLRDLVEELGCKVAHVSNVVADAIVFAETGDFDAALLDVEIAGQDVHPVVERLAARDLPFAFVTGRGLARPKTGPYRDRPVLNKPISKPGLEKILLLLARMPRRSPQDLA
ncbi:MAG: hypothetical protein LC632_00465 [Xanthomonadaceae bacterium]|nr:hypothetical protein [Xanthomonadaceae bacterium]